MPVALISNGTTENHRTYRTNISDLPEFVLANQIKPPTLVVIGRVVNALDTEGFDQATLLDEASRHEQMMTKVG